jgi:hypothetical protein
MMKAPYKILSNQGMWDPDHPKRFGTGWEPDDALVCSDEGEIEDDSDDIVTVAEHLFEIYNRDDRPNGQVAHSLSVGDVVIIGEVALACESIGWTPVTGPFNIQESTNGP